MGLSSLVDTTTCGARFGVPEVWGVLRIEKEDTMTIQLAHHINLQKVDHVQVLDINLIECRSGHHDAAKVQVRAFTQDGIIVGEWWLCVFNGTGPIELATACLQECVTPEWVANLFETKLLTKPTAYTNLLNAWRGPGTKEQRLAAVEQQGIADGWLPPGTVT